MALLKYTANDVEYSVLASALPSAAIDYLLQYGFAKSLQDCVAGVAKGLKAKEKSEAEITAKLVETHRARFDAILEGTVGTRANGVPRVKGDDKLRRDIALEALRAHAASKKAKLPEGEALAGLVAKYLAKYGETVEAELARRKALRVEAEGLDDLFGDDEAEGGEEGEGEEGEADAE